MEYTHTLTPNVSWMQQYTVLYVCSVFFSSLYSTPFTWLVFFSSMLCRSPVTHHLHKAAGVKQKSSSDNDDAGAWNVRRWIGKMVAWSLIKSLYSVCVSYAWHKRKSARVFVSFEWMFLLDHPLQAATTALRHLGTRQLTAQLLVCLYSH